MDVEALKKLKGTVEKCIVALSEKSDLSPAETKAALDGMQLRDMLQCEIENCKMQEEVYSGAPRHYTMTAYGQHRDAMGRYSSHPNYGIGGWYENNYHDGHDYEQGYSRHSIGDRAVSKLEHLMDTTQSEYEREELRKYIRMIRQAAD